MKVAGLDGPRTLTTQMALDLCRDPGPSTDQRSYGYGFSRWFNLRLVALLLVLIPIVLRQQRQMIRGYEGQTSRPSVTTRMVPGPSTEDTAGGRGLSLRDRFQKGPWWVFSPAGFLLRGVDDGLRVSGAPGQLNEGDPHRAHRQCLLRCRHGPPLARQRRKMVAAPARDLRVDSEAVMRGPAD